jgi:hypothetical protein
VGSLEGGNTRDVAVAGQVAVVGTDEGYAQFVSLADVTEPALLSTHEMSSAVWGVDLAGDLAYIATFSAIDVVNVETGETLWTVTHDAGANFKVQVSGDRLYVARGGQGSGLGLAIYALSADSAPELLAEHLMDGAVRNLRVDGDIVYMAIKYSDAADLRVWDVTSATEPVELATYSHPTSTSSDGIALAKGHAYLGLSHDLVVLDATCPQTQTCSVAGQCTP